MNNAKENSNNSSIEEIKGEIKKRMNILGDVIAQFNHVAAELQQRLVSVVEEALDDEQIKVSVGFEFWSSELIPEDIDFKIELWCEQGDGTPCIHYTNLLHLFASLNLENISIKPEDNHLVLYIGCRNLASCLGCDMSIWDGEN